MTEKFRFYSAAAKVYKLAGLFCTMILLACAAASNVSAQGFNPQKVKLENLEKSIPQYPDISYGANRVDGINYAKYEHQAYINTLNDVYKKGEGLLASLYKECIRNAQDFNDQEKQAQNKKKCDEEHQKRVASFRSKIMPAYDAARAELRPRLDKIGKYWDRIDPSLLKIDGRDGRAYSQKQEPPKKVGPKQGRWKEGRYVID